MLQCGRCIAVAAVCAADKIRARVLQCVAVCCSVCRSVSQCVAVCCSVMQCVAVCCSGVHVLRLLYVLLIRLMHV